MTNEQIGLGSEKYSGITNEAIGLGSPKLHGGSNDAIGLYQPSFNTKYSNITEQEIKNSLYSANIECEKWRSLLSTCLRKKIFNPFYRCAKAKNQGYKRSYLQSQVNKCKAEIAGLNKLIADLSEGAYPDSVGDSVRDTSPAGGINTGTAIIGIGVLIALIIGLSLIFKRQPAIKTA